MEAIVIIVIVAVVVVVLIALAAFFLSRRQQQQRQESARQEYGTEYDRTAEELGSERKAEKELRNERERVDSEVQSLSEESRENYESRWQEVERTFVDDPVSSLDSADQVVQDIMRERNFPAGSRQEATREVGVMHSDVADEFREAQRVHREATGGSEGEGEQATDGSGGEGHGTDSEKMRQALQKYRDVYERLIKD